jgi:hypothetical protein
LELPRDVIAYKSSKLWRDLNAWLLRRWECIGVFGWPIVCVPRSMRHCG